VTQQATLIAGAWREAPAGTPTLASLNPATGEALPDTYPVSDWVNLEAALYAARAAQAQLLARPDWAEALAGFLEGYAAQLEARADALVEMAHLETALPREPRLKAVELPRTIAQLRLAAAAAREPSWRQATLDTRGKLRSYFAPLDGPVFVLGANNFPFAFNGVAGGDMAAALASGHPVLTKAHPGHLGTSRLLAEAAWAALQAGDLPPALMQMIYHLAPEDGLRLVAHPLLGATAFTGSRAVGVRLKAAADAAGKPIYLELSAINPVFFLPGALAERGPALVDEYVASGLLGAGQFCTNPGLLLLVDDAAGRAFVDGVAAKFAAAKPGVLLSANAPEQLRQAVAALHAHGAEVVVGGQPVPGPASCFNNTLLRVSGDAFLAEPEALQREAFGPTGLVVLARDADQLAAIAEVLEGNLTGSFYTHTGAADDALYARLAPVVRRKVGRLLNDKMPTGVAVSPAMMHGGPYPSSGHPGFTSVGLPASMRRFAALQCFDNVRPDRLPPELRDVNPTGRMWRLIDGGWTQGDVPAA